MVITHYSQMSTFARIVYNSYQAGRTTAETVQLLYERGKITLEERDFILSS
jgi:hypothetical protein